MEFSIRIALQSHLKCSFFFFFCVCVRVAVAYRFLECSSTSYDFKFQPMSVLGLASPTNIPERISTPDITFRHPNYIHRFKFDLITINVREPYFVCNISPVYESCLHTTISLCLEQHVYTTLLHECLSPQMKCLFIICLCCLFNSCLFAQFC